MKKVLLWAKNIIIPLVVGGIVGLIMIKFIDYDLLNKPPLAPPGIVFPIAWTIIYILMGVSYSLLEINDLNDKEVNIIYYIQLFVNALWSIIFFVFKWRLFAVAWIIMLVLLVSYMIVIFYKRNKLSGLLQIPYLLWCIFATYLNMAIYLLN